MIYRNGYYLLLLLLLLFKLNTIPNLLIRGKPYNLGTAITCFRMILLVHPLCNHIDMPNITQRVKMHQSPRARGGINFIAILRLIAHTKILTSSWLNGKHRGPIAIIRGAIFKRSMLLLWYAICFSM